MRSMALIAQQDAKEKKRLQEAHDAMRKRLEKLPDDNEIIESVLKKDADKEKKDDKYAQWEIVNELVSTACSKFMDGDLTFEESTEQLAQALQGLSKK